MEGNSSFFNKCLQKKCWKFIERRSKIVWKWCLYDIRTKEKKICKMTTTHTLQTNKLITNTIEYKCKPINSIAKFQEAFSISIFCYFWRIKAIYFTVCMAMLRQIKFKIEKKKNEEPEDTMMNGFNHTLFVCKHILIVFDMTILRLNFTRTQKERIVYIVQDTFTKDVNKTEEEDK